MTQTYRLVLDCPDQSGIITKVGSVITENGGWISHASHHSDEDSNHFFSRIEIKADSLPFGLETLQEKLQPTIDELKMNVKLVDSSAKKKVILMVSKGSHCLTDILDRWKSGDLNCEISCVISNHDDLRSLSEFYGLTYHHVAINKDNKAAGFAETERLVDQYDPNCIVLARYMQIIPQVLCEKYRHKVINIHHSFLPSFIGAKPYHQASMRGVKLIGATCHYVTEQLDEGPIIDQDVRRVSHSDTVDELVMRGKDVEKVVLARGLRAHLEDRILVHGNKTVILD